MHIHTEIQYNMFYTRLKLMLPISSSMKVCNFQKFSFIKIKHKLLNCFEHTYSASILSMYFQHFHRGCDNDLTRPCTSTGQNFLTNCQTFPRSVTKHFSKCIVCNKLNCFFRDNQQKIYR